MADDRTTIVDDVLHVEYPCPYPGCGARWLTPQLGGYGPTERWPENVKVAAIAYDSQRRDHFRASHRLAPNQLDAGRAVRDTFGPDAAELAAGQLWHTGTYRATGGSLMAMRSAEERAAMGEEGRHMMSLARALHPEVFATLPHDTEETP